MREHIQHDFLWGAQRKWQIKQTAKSGWKRMTRDTQTDEGPNTECHRASGMFMDQPQTVHSTHEKMHCKYQRLTTNKDFEDETLYVTGAFTLAFKFNISYT